MEQPSSQAKRTYLNHPLVKESLQALPLALQYPQVADFRKHVVDLLPQNSLKGRRRIAGYPTQRFSDGERMNLDFARALAR